MNDNDLILFPDDRCLKTSEVSEPRRPEVDLPRPYDYARGRRLG